MQYALLSVLHSVPVADIKTTKTSSSKRKRKQPSNKNTFLPDGSPDQATCSEGFEFDETLDEKTLHNKSCVINRAPVMMAWAMVVAERLGFKREESLSIGQSHSLTFFLLLFIRLFLASVYTEMNAVSKGLSLGLFDEGKRKNTEASPTGTQPYVELMGRR